MLRKMSAEKLLKTLPVIQEQMDALLEFDVRAANEQECKCFYKDTIG